MEYILIMHRMAPSPVVRVMITLATEYILLIRLIMALLGIVKVAVMLLME